MYKFVIVFALILTACRPFESTVTLQSNPSSTDVSSNTPSDSEIEPAATHTPADPCIGAPAPAQWNHVVVLIFENKRYAEVIGKAPYITDLAEKCATVVDWKDADTKVDGSFDGDYPSKPSYATLTSGLPPSVHGLVDNSYIAMSDVDNIYNQLDLAGKSFKVYIDAPSGGCATKFVGDYHDSIRYYTNVASICSDHDVPLSTLMEDLNSGNLPAFSVILPSNRHNMHDNSVRSGDAFAQSILDPILESPTYIKGDVAIFFLWDEDTPIPNVLLAPSITAGTTISITNGNPISHFSALRTWEEMLGLPFLGDTDQAPSLLSFFGRH